VGQHDPSIHVPVVVSQHDAPHTTDDSLGQQRPLMVLHASNSEQQVVVLPMMPVHTWAGGLQHCWPKQTCGDGQQSPPLPQVSGSAQQAPWTHCDASAGQHASPQMSPAPGTQQRGTPGDVSPRHTDASDGQHMAKPGIDVSPHTSPVSLAKQNAPVWPLTQRSPANAPSRQDVAQQSDELSQHVARGFDAPPQHTAPSEHVALQYVDGEDAFGVPPGQGTEQQASPDTQESWQSLTPFVQLANARVYAA
jgi:hypothetical protein